MQRQDFGVPLKKKRTARYLLPLNLQVLRNNGKTLLAAGRTNTNMLTPFAFSMPKLSPGSSLQPYVHQNDDVATVDTSRIVTEGQKRQSNMIHHVERTEGATSKAKKVSSISRFIISCRLLPISPKCHDENLPKRFMRSMQLYESVLDSPAIMRVYIDS